MKIKDVLIKSNEEYRIIYIDDDFVKVIKLNSSAIITLTEKTDLINQQIEMGLIQIKDNENITSLDISKLTSKQFDKYHKYLELIVKFKESFSPYFDVLNPRFAKHHKKLMDEYYLSKCTYWRIVRRYLQSGFDNHSLIDRRSFTHEKDISYKNKVGRKSNSELGVGIPINRKEKDQFDEAINYYLSGRNITISNTYQHILIKYYSKKDSDNNLIIVPENMRPTYKQFRNYLKKEVAGERFNTAKYSKSENINEHRLLISDNLKNVKGPMDAVEVDECEFDISLISSYSNFTVGRPILYIMRDVYSRVIVAYSLSFENNSFLGITNCLYSLVKDKTDFLKQNNLVLDNWPFYYLPNRIRCDYGSEYISKDLDEILRRNFISKDLVPPAAGSLKGEVEQFFHQIQSNSKPLTANKGLISKEHGSNHHKTATMNIDEFKTIVIRFINYINNSELANYPLTKDMVNCLDIVTPLTLFEYGIKVYGEPRIINDSECFVYSLLKPIKVKIDRFGISFKGLNYFDAGIKELKDLMYKNFKRSVSLDARIDPRDISYIYINFSTSKYIDESIIKKIPLNPDKAGNSDYKELTLFEYEKIYSENLKRKREAVDHNTINKALMNEENKIYIKTLKKDKADPTNISSARDIEKIKRRKQEKLINNDVLNETKEIQSDDDFEFKEDESLDDILKDMWSRYYEI